MCTSKCLLFAAEQLSQDDIAGKRVLEVGSFDVNGSLRGIVTRHRPSEYIGVDIASGPGVDVVCDAASILSEFGPESFDVVISTEMLEHVPHWRPVIHNIKHLLKPRGIVVLTTRSRGFHYHGYPGDYWRFEVCHLRDIFADFRIDALESDVDESPGVMIRARRPVSFVEVDLSNYRVYSILWRRLRVDSSMLDIYLARVLTKTKSLVSRVLPPGWSIMLRKVSNNLFVKK